MTQNKKTANFGFGKISKEGEVALNVLRGEICKNMEEYDALIGIKDFDDMVKVLSFAATDVCAQYVDDKQRKANPERFENFVKLVLNDILCRI